MGDSLSPSEEEVLQPVLGRAFTILGVSLNLHAWKDSREASCVAGCGAAAACAHVAKLPWGGQSCRRSREKAGEAALRRGKPVPFICHMGFPCVATPVPELDGDHVLTLGPYCPDDAPGSLKNDAHDGLRALNDYHDELPFTVDDIPVVPSNAPMELALWTAESFELYEDPPHSADEPESAQNTSTIDYGPRRRFRPVRDPYQSTDIASALAAGSQDNARTIVRALLEDTESSKTKQLSVKKARAVALAAATLEAAERLGLDTAASWRAFPAMSKSASKAETALELSDAVMKVLSPLKRSRSEGGDGQLGDLYALVVRNLARGITLREAAQALDLKPDALSKRLKRKLGMSFGDYLGRVRVDKAKESLRKTSRSVKDIARSVGLNDAGNFSKLFRRFEGATPSQYRRRFGQQKRGAK